MFLMGFSRFDISDINLLMGGGMKINFFGFGLSVDVDIFKFKGL